jgi:hypothetical protein
MIRALLVAAAITAAAWGTAIGTAPEGRTEAADAPCTMEAYGNCVYANCTEAKANGRCNIKSSDPDYCPKQDRDGDGIACEC